METTRLLSPPVYYRCSCRRCGHSSRVSLASIALVMVYQRRVRAAATAARHWAAKQQIASHVPPAHTVVRTAYVRELHGLPDDRTDDTALPQWHSHTTCIHTKYACVCTHVSIETGVLAYKRVFVVRNNICSCGVGFTVAVWHQRGVVLPASKQSSTDISARILHAGSGRISHVLHAVYRWEVLPRRRKAVRVSCW